MSARSPQPVLMETLPGSWKKWPLSDLVPAPVPCSIWATSQSSGNPNQDQIRKGSIITCAGLAVQVGLLCRCGARGGGRRYGGTRLILGRPQGARRGVASACAPASSAKDRKEDGSQMAWSQEAGGASGAWHAPRASACSNQAPP